jgi:hypothetical protein
MKMPKPHSWYSVQDEEWMKNAVYTQHAKQNTFTHRGGTFKTPLYDKQAMRDLLEAAAVECERLFDLRDCDLARLHAAKCAAAILKLKEKL